MRRTGPQRAQATGRRCHDFKAAERDTGIHNSLSLGTARQEARGRREGAFCSVLLKSGESLVTPRESLTKPQACRGAEAKQNRPGTIPSL